MQTGKVRHPKVVLIGAGSLFFGRQAIANMVRSPYLNGGTLALVDTDPIRLEKMARLTEMVVAANDVPLAVEASTDRKEVLPDADFVILSFAHRSVEFRGLECQISAQFGIRMCSGDTIGPGGIFRALRELPEILACARDVASLCPDAWVINYVNPAAVIGIGLRRYAPEVRSFALCDGLHLPYAKHRYAVQAGIVADQSGYSDQIDAAFDLRIAGVNHFTWMLRAEYEGQDVMPRIAASMHAAAQAGLDAEPGGSKWRFNDAIGYALFQAFGYVPTCVAHTKEYVRFWQDLGRTPEPIPPLALWEAEPRNRMHDAMWSQVDGFLTGRAPVTAYLDTFGSDLATDVIESMVGGLGKPYYVNTFNQGTVTNMADDAYLELCCDVGSDGISPRPVGEMPRGLRGLQEQVLDTHELTAEAAVTCDYRLLRRAMLTDPLTSSIGDADAIIAALLQAEKDVLPECWSCD